MEVPGDFQYRDPETEKMLNEVGQMLRKHTPPGYGFIFLLASIGEGGGLFYTSNLNRHDVCNVMREFIQKAEPQ